MGWFLMYSEKVMEYFKSIEEQYKEGYALEIKWDSRQFKPNKYKKFNNAYPNFPLSCIDFYDNEILSY